MEQVSRTHEEELNISQTGINGKIKGREKGHERGRKTNAQIFVRRKSIPLKAGIIKEKSRGGLKCRVAKCHVKGSGRTWVMDGLVILVYYE